MYNMSSFEAATHFHMKELTRLDVIASTRISLHFFFASQIGPLLMAGLLDTGVHTGCRSNAARYFGEFRIVLKNNGSTSVAVATPMMVWGR